MLIFAGFITLSGLTPVPAQAAEWDKPAKLSIGISLAGKCNSDNPPTIKEAPSCYSVGMTSSRAYPLKLALWARPGATKFTLKNLGTGKNVALNGNYIQHPRSWDTHWMDSSTYPTSGVLPAGKYEATVTLDYPAGSTCDSSNWCTSLPRYQETRYHQFDWKNKDLQTGQTFKANSTKKVTKATTYTSTRSATHTAKASHTATATASYKYKGKTYTATASHKVTKTHAVKKTANHTVRNLKKTGTATRAGTSKVSQAAANESAATAATRAATDLAVKSARSHADNLATAAAKKLLTSKVKESANASAKAKITKSVKAAALKEAKAKAWAAAKKKAK